MATKQTNPLIAAVLSLFIPGLGQVYAGEVIWGVVWFLFSTSCCLVTGGIGSLFNILCAVHAFVVASTEDA